MHVVARFVQKRITCFYCVIMASLRGMQINIYARPFQFAFLAQFAHHQNLSCTCTVCIFSNCSDRTLSSSVCINQCTCVHDLMSAWGDQWVFWHTIKGKGSFSYGSLTVHDTSSGLHSLQWANGGRH